MEGIANALTHEEAVEKAKELAATIKTRFKLTEEISRQPEETIQELERVRFNSCHGTKTFWRK